MISIDSGFSVSHQLKRTASQAGRAGGMEPKRRQVVLRDGNRGRYEGDRFIPPRSLLHQPAAAFFNEPRLPRPRGVEGVLYGAALSEALTGERRDPTYARVLRRSGREGAYERPLSLRLGEEYPAGSSEIGDVEGVLDEFYRVAAAYWPKGDRLAIIGGELDPDNEGRIGGRIYLYDAKTKDVVAAFPSDRVYPEGRNPVSVAFHPKEKAVIVGLKDGTIEFWSIEGDRPQKTLEIHPARHLNKKVARISVISIWRGKIYAGDWKGRLFVIDRKKEVAACVRAHKTYLCSIAFSPDGRFLATGGEDFRVVMRRVETLEEVSSFQMKSRTARGLAFEPNGRPYLACGGGHDDPRLQVYQIFHPEEKPKIDVWIGSQITTVLWRDADRIILTDSTGMCTVLPIDLDRSTDALGCGTRFPLLAGRVLFSALREQGEERSLICVGMEDGGGHFLFTPFPPKAPVRAAARESIFERPPLNLSK